LPSLIAVDPGATTGWALFDTSAQRPVEVGEVRKEKFFGFLEGNTEHGLVWVVENYIIRPPGKAGGFDHSWNTGDTLKLIGAIEYHARVYKQLFYLQQPNIKPLAYKQMGAEYKKGKPGMHIQDAIAHGVHFIGKNYA
jgi:hypothetical protein